MGAMRAAQRRWELALALLALAGLAGADLSRPGGGGHALLFRDHGVVIENFNDLAPNEFTFEAWVRTSDTCHRSALFSYALPSTATRRQDNHFVIFDPQKLVACHDFEFLDLWPDPNFVSCYAAFNHSKALPDITARDGRWRHLAVTWTAAGNGLTRIYVDGLLRVETPSGKTAPLQPGGALMLGAEQDCYGGCLDQGQGFHGEMDEVRIWRVARSQADILAHMRDASGLERHPDLAAYWGFNDPEEEGLFRTNLAAKDASGRGNDLRLVTFPAASRARITHGAQSLDAGVLTFRNNYAMNQGFRGMPDKDVSVEFWARLPALNNSAVVSYNEFFSFATNVLDPGGRTTAAFVDDAILIERYTEEFRGTAWLEGTDVSTAGAISVHINANREGMGARNDHWIDFAVGWTDAEWHHVAVTWAQASGEVALYFDGAPQTPFWVSQGGVTSAKDPERGGVDRRIAAGTRRDADGSLVVGNKQESMGGGFTPMYGMHGDMANLRVWSRVLSPQEVTASMWAPDQPRREGLAFSYSFDPGNVQVDAKQGIALVKDAASPYGNDLYLGADAPAWVYSTAPLAAKDGAPVAAPTPGAAGHAMFLSDQQVLIHKGFADFPAQELTVEFWMQSVDGCRKGVPFSYAHGAYGKGDNAFLIFDYNDWGVSAMEDEGTLSDHTSGVASTDGKWHHIAVTWRSSDGATKLYDNGREVWSVTRGRGKSIPSGGTLVVGREQDCEGGCFDSTPGAAGDVSPRFKQEYGAQDFFGLLDELRVWRRVRTAEEIAAGMAANLHAKGRTGRGASPGVDPKHPDLVAYWNFDEGRGYTVRDITGHGHDLLATQLPRWEVVRWLAVCGNGVVEGLEECDDGNAQGGEGCSSECRVEKGWTCTATSPSKCWKTGDQPPAPTPPSGGGGDAPAPGPGPAPGPAPGQPRRHRGARIALIVITVLVAAAAAGAALFIQRGAIYAQFPVVEDAVSAVRERLLGGARAYEYGGGLDLGPEDAADFTSIRPAPGHGGYSRLGDAARASGP